MRSPDFRAADRRRLDSVRVGLWKGRATRPRGCGWTRHESRDLKAEAKLSGLGAGNSIPGGGTAWPKLDAEDMWLIYVTGKRPV